MDSKTVIEIFNNHAKDIYRYAYSRCYSKQLAEDVTSHAFEKLMSAKKIRVEDAKFWLMRVAKNELINRGKKASRTYADLDAINGTEFEVSTDDIATTVVSEVLVNEVFTALKDLDPVTREVITMRIWDSAQFSEIAEFTELTEDAARKRFYRGVEYLKNKVTREEKQTKHVMAAILGVASLGSYQLSQQFINITLTSMATGTATAATSAASTAAAASTTATGTGFAGLSLPMVGGIVTTVVIAAGGAVAVATGAISLPGNQTVVTSSMSSSTSSAPVSYAQSTTTQSSETATESSSTTSQAPSIRQRPELPAGWTWTAFDKCDVEVPTPPVSTLGDGENTFTVEWKAHISEGKGLAVDEITNKLSISDVLFDSKGDIMGTDFAYGVRLTCSTNILELSTAEYANNVKSNKSNFALAGQLTDKGKLYPWGFETRVLFFTDNPSLPEVNHHFFALGDKLYTVDANWADSSEGKPAKTIFNNLYFRNAPPCEDRKITNPLLEDFSYEFNTCEWKRSSNFKESMTVYDQWNETLVNKSNGGKLKFSFTISDTLDAVPTCEGLPYNILNNGHARLRSGSDSYFYWDKIDVKGTDGYNDRITFGGGIWDTDNPSYCRNSDIPFSPISKVRYQDRFAPVELDITYNGKKPVLADKVIETLKLQ